MTKINISIPQPCHENWEAMTSVEKGKFCGSCQKKVFDFTSSSDREIINAFEKDNHLCGRFLNTQLDRDLVKPKEKSTIWLAAATALISLVGTNEVTSQEKATTEQTNRKIVGKPAAPKAIEENILVSGIIYDENKTPMPNLEIYINRNRVGKTDENGNFSINAYLGARIEFRGMSDDYNEDSTMYYVNKRIGNANIEINAEKIHKIIHITSVGLISLEAQPLKRRTFFGRLFHKSKYR